MIHVELQPEPADFDALVRQPGLLFLHKLPNSSSPDFRKPNNHWTKIIPQLRTAYSQICAYCCEYIPYGTGHRQVDHFWPKSKKPYPLAYEWSNYRLACGIVNSRKGTKEVLDPFRIKDGWFRMKFPSLLIEPAPTSELPTGITRQQIWDTITNLGLNDRGENIPARKQHIDVYCRNNDFQHLMDMAPFIAKELIRQNYVQTIKAMMALQTP
jgi:hypothetical protein